MCRALVDIEISFSISNLRKKRFIELGIDRKDVDIFAQSRSLIIFTCRVVRLWY